MSTSTAIHAAAVRTPHGDLTVLVDGAGAVTRILFPHEAAPADAVWDAARCAEPVAQLEAFFRGERADFDLPLAPRGTPFQRQVWEELARIPYGVSISYRELAARVGRPGAVRAVGRANATNPIPIVVPCHRVIGSNGSLTGYAGGVALKEALLRLEAAAGRAPAAA